MHVALKSAAALRHARTAGPLPLPAHGSHSPDLYGGGVAICEGATKDIPRELARDVARIASPLAVQTSVSDRFSTASGSFWLAPKKTALALLSVGGRNLSDHSVTTYFGAQTMGLFLSESRSKGLFPLHVFLNTRTLTRIHVFTGGLHGYSVPRTHWDTLLNPKNFNSKHPHVSCRAKQSFGRLGLAQLPHVSS